MLHDYSNENVGETNNEKTKKKINCEFLNQETFPYKPKTLKNIVFDGKIPNTLRDMKG